MASPAPEDSPSPPPDRGTFVLVYDAALKDAAIEWAAYRAEDGWRVIMQPVEAAHSSPASAAVTEAKAVRELIRAHWRLAKPDDPSRFMVLLLGDAPTASATSSTTPGSTQIPGAEAGIPGWRFQQTDTDMQLSRDRTYISDHPYQLMDDADDVPDVPLGRVPARTNEEARVALEKIRRHETAGRLEMAEGLARVTYVAGEGHYGLTDSVLESMFKTMVDQLVPAEFNVTMTYAKATSPYCPPPSLLTDTVLMRLGEGCVLFNYVGHGFERGFDALTWRGTSIPILRVADVARLGRVANDDGPLPIALLTCCSTGWFDLPGGANCLAEAMLFNPHGPVAVIAGSRVTHPYANIIVQKDVTKLMLRDRTATVGMLDLLAARSMVGLDDEDRQIDALAAPVALAGRWKTNLNDLRRMHVRLYNLLGDPATRIMLPSAGIESLALDGSRLTATVPGMMNGVAYITVETPRTAFARAGDLQPVIDPDDPDLESKAANNYAIANDRVLFRTTAPVRDGRIETTLNDVATARGGVIIRVRATGSNEAGERCSAIGAMELARADATTVNRGE